jgi:arylsulfatase
MSEAIKYHVLPLDDRTLDRLNAALVGRPDLMAGRTTLTVFQGMVGMSENVFINIKNRSHTITAEVDSGTNGVILAQAGRFGGWSLYLKDGKPMYTYNWLGLEEYTVAATEALPAGKSTIRFEFVYDGDGVGKGGAVTILVNNKSVATGRIEKTQGAMFSADEGADVGADEGTAVAKAYAVPFKFNGKIGKVTIELKPTTTATAIEGEKARKESAVKIALSN